MACQLAKDSMHDELTRVAALRDRLEKGIVSQIPDTLVNGDTENRVPNTTNISFRNIEGEAILLMLNQYNICASSGLRLHVRLPRALSRAACHGRAV